ncbi:hypothetical protein ACH5RR_033919 [Cinchona calisaya]|uniref:Uncharacterized protein n=1 Tax=Cinchona calisaya TaxID=153742 RepID=A0ABD2YET8_9GENT
MPASTLLTIGCYEGKDTDKEDEERKGARISKDSAADEYEILGDGDEVDIEEDGVAKDVDELIFEEAREGRCGQPPGESDMNGPGPWRESQLIFSRIPYQLGEKGFPVANNFPRPLITLTHKGFYDWENYLTKEIECSFLRVGVVRLLSDRIREVFTIFSSLGLIILLQQSKLRNESNGNLALDFEIIHSTMKKF